jgi:hypothetical protein
LQPERRKEERQSSGLKVGVFLSQGKNGPPLSPTFWGKLISISRQGAGVALDKIMFDRTHIALGPMSSDTLQLNIIVSSPEADSPPLTLPVKPVWFDKKSDDAMPQFRIGMEFLDLLSSDQLKQANRLLP